MFRIEPDRNFKEVLRQLPRVKENIALLEQAAAYMLAEYALKGILHGMPDEPAYVKAFKDSLQVARILTPGQPGAAAAIVGKLRVTFEGADPDSTLVLFPPGLQTDPAGSFLADAALQPWAIDQLPPVAVRGTVVLRLREPSEVSARRKANFLQRTSTFENMLKVPGIRFDEAKFTPVGPVELDLVDLALQIEHGGPGFISVPRWRKMVAFFKESSNAETVLGRVFIDAAEKGIFSSSRDVIERIVPKIQARITEQQAAELGTRVGNLRKFAEILGGYPLT